MDKMEQPWKTIYSLQLGVLRRVFPIDSPRAPPTGLINISIHIDAGPPEDAIIGQCGAEILPVMQSTKKRMTRRKWWNFKGNIGYLLHLGSWHSHSLYVTKAALSSLLRQCRRRSIASEQCHYFKWYFIGCFCLMPGQRGGTWYVP